MSFMLELPTATEDAVDPDGFSETADGVPFFIVNGTFTLSGAQQPEAFLEAFQRAAAGRAGC
jgi:hypothetical protein